MTFQLFKDSLKELSTGIILENLKQSQDVLLCSLNLPKLNVMLRSYQRKTE